MNRSALTAALALGLALAACQNEPEEEAAGSSSDSITPPTPETANGDEVVSEGPTDDATPFAGTTGAGVDGSASSSGSMQSGASTQGQRPPKGSKLQKADPQ